MKKINLIWTAVLALTIAHGQKQGNIWYFGDQVGLDFSSGNPIVISGATYTVTNCIAEGTSVISDSSGSLLFYTNGQEIWNRNHTIMPNGDSVLGNLSSTQSSIIVPQPLSSRYFYVFTTSDLYCDTLKYGFRYSVVDICLDNGLGDVILNKKNIKLLDTVAEKLTAVKHANGIDYWIITHKYFSDAFYAYQLSAAGIIDTVITHIGSIHPQNMIGNGAAIGELKASPNGQMLAIVNGNSNQSIVEYFDFDKNLGIVSNCRNIQTNTLYNHYGISFSPDNSKLYLTCWLNNNGLYQYDLNAGSGNADSVKASRTQISNKTFYGLQLANNGKIYLNRTGSIYYLVVINNPNNLGMACNFQDSAIYLNGKADYMSFPNFIDSYDYSNTIYNCQTGIQEEDYSDKISIYPNPFTTQTTLWTAEQFKNITLTVDNCFGQTVAQIKNISGQTITFNRDNLASGLYFVRLTEENKTIAVGKLVITDK